MAFVDITSDQHAVYGTHSHAEEGFATRGGTYPAQLKWSDLHPPGVRVLPKGSPPAGPGEINWEDTLGGKFALAVEKLVLQRYLGPKLRRLRHLRTVSIGQTRLPPYPCATPPGLSSRICGDLPATRRPVSENVAL